MKNIIRILGVLLIGVIIVMASPLAAMAATTADVTITATPTYVAMTNTPATWAIGTVAASTNYSTSATYFTTNNTGSVTSNITIKANTGTNWTGGSGWFHSETSAAGADTVGLMCNPKDSGASNFSIKNAAASALYTGLATANTTRWGLLFISPSSMNDGAVKTMVVRLTIVQQ